MTPEQLAAIRARAEAATPGPWHDGQDGMVYSTCQPGCAVVINDIDLAVEDAEFIAHARDDIPRLLDEVEALRARAERAEREVERLREERAALHRALGDALHIASYAPGLVGFEEAEHEARVLWESLKDAVGKDGA